MATRRNRYHEMKRIMSFALITDAALFILYLLFAGLGITWLKVILSILIIFLSGACLVFLFFTQELLRQRSLWMTVASAAILLCLLFSLLLNYPSPNNFMQDFDSANTAVEYTILENLTY